LYLYYITDRKQLSAETSDQARLLLERVRMAAEAGVDWIQLREKDLSDRELLDLGRSAVGVVAGVNSQRPENPVRLLINSRVDVAIACGADGVHLRSDDISAADARTVFMQAGIGESVIGVSCHTAEEVALAEGNGANFAILAPIFEVSGKRVPVGMAELRRSCQRRPIPVLALGGVTAHNAAECLAAGAQGIAGIRLFQSGNLQETIADLRALESK
jgi:thiamine-phosphate pyrophosphorylase